MKILVVYNQQGQLVFTQTNATDSYNLLVEDVADNKEIVGVDVSAGKCILVDREATTKEKERLQLELEQKNKELEDKENELLEAQAKYTDVLLNSLS